MHPCSDEQARIHWFERGVSHLIEKGIARAESIGHAHCVLMPAKEAVDEIVAWRKMNDI